jgi:hypothetical protein
VRLGINIVCLYAVAFGATELPIHELPKYGVAATCLALVFWLVAKTIPSLIHAQSTHIKQLTDAQEQATNRLVEHLDGVKAAITHAAQNEAALLRQLIQDKHK